MGINIAGWQENVLASVTGKGIAAEINSAGNAFLLVFKDFPRLVLHLISLKNEFEAGELLQLREEYRLKDILLVQLWEDIWHTRHLQVLSRVSSMLGQNQTIHGRKTKVAAVTQPQADQFLAQFHLQGSAKARHRYALMLAEEIVAVATFSAKRNMTRRREGYTSVELIRFASRDGFTIQGGLSKLIKHMVNTLEPSDVMTYADMDWSDGRGYSRLGFELTAQLPPATLWLDGQTLQRYFPHRLPAAVQQEMEGRDPLQKKAHLADLHYYRIFNTGNLKYILYL